VYKRQHLDAYRVGGADDFEAIGFAELLAQQGLVVIEWASRVSQLLPSDAIHVHIEPTGATDRRITLGGTPLLP
jgi:tRNA threonylcarbamoyladenosine biosynthesis protein TsaE